MARLRARSIPKDPLNAVIVDIDLAPRNAHGMVEYSTDFQLLLPMTSSEGNHRLLYEITNRGSTNALTILNSAKTANTKTSPRSRQRLPDEPGLCDPGKRVGHHRCRADRSGFRGDCARSRHKGGKPITGPATEEFDIDVEQYAANRTAVLSRGKRRQVARPA